MGCNCQDDFSPENIATNGCPCQIPGDCIYYTGAFISGIGIASGDSFNTVIRKIALYLGGVDATLGELEEDVDVLSGQFGTTTSSTTTTTTTAPPATTTTTTTTTSSTTTTTTTAAPLDTIYIGAKASGTAPNESEILAGEDSQQDGSEDVSADWTAMTGTPQYVWFAIPNLGTAYNKNHWYVNAGNQGDIGTVDDLFGAPTIVSVSGDSYFVWISNYATQFTANALLQRI